MVAQYVLWPVLRLHLPSYSPRAYQLKLIAWSILRAGASVGASLAFRTWCSAVSEFQFLAFSMISSLDTAGRKEVPLADPDTHISIVAASSCCVAVSE